MKNKTLKKLLLPVFILALCFISIKTPANSSPTSSEIQIDPLSDREDFDDMRDH